MRILIFEDEGCVDIAERALRAAQWHQVVGVSRSVNDAIRLARTAKADIALVLSISEGSDDAFSLMHSLSKSGVPSLLLNCEADQADPTSVSNRWRELGLSAVLARHRGKYRADDENNSS